MVPVRDNSSGIAACRRFLEKRNAGSNGIRTAPPTDGRKITPNLFDRLLAEELVQIRKLLGASTWRAGSYDDAANLFKEITTSEDYPELLTLPAYDIISGNTCAQHHSRTECTA